MNNYYQQQQQQNQVTPVRAGSSGYDPSTTNEYLQLYQEQQYQYQQRQQQYLQQQLQYQQQELRAVQTQQQPNSPPPPPPQFAQNHYKHANSISPPSERPMLPPPTATSTRN